LYLHASNAEESICRYFQRKLKILMDTSVPLTLQTFSEDINPYTFIFGSVRNPYTLTVYDLYAKHIINPSMRDDEVEGLLLAFLTDKSSQYTCFINEEGVIDPRVKVVKHESLEQDMSDIGFDSFKMMKQHESYDQLTLKSVEAINKVYAQDFEHFGYELITTQEKLDSLYTPGKKRYSERQREKIMKGTPREKVLNSEPMKPLPPPMKSAPMNPSMKSTPMNQPMKSPPMNPPMKSPPMNPLMKSPPMNPPMTSTPILQQMNNIMNQPNYPIPQPQIRPKEFLRQRLHFFN
jgi:hypothetical protein